MSRILIVFGTKIDDVLERCYDCKMMDWGDDFCVLTGKRRSHEGHDGFPEYCPLPEVPTNTNKVK